jgi:hypothetical protein
MAQLGEKDRRDPPGAAGTSRVAATVWLWVVVAMLAGMVWLQAQHPFFGLPLTHPLNLFLFGLCLAVGVGFTAYIWLFEGKGRKSAEALTAAGLPEEVRRLADAGRKIEAIQALRQETGASLATACAAVEEYLRHQRGHC